MSSLNEFFIGFRNCRQDIKPWGIPRIHFLRSEWEEISHPQVSWLYLTWRGLYALFCIFTVIFSICASSHPHLWLIFLTRWSLTCQLVYSLLFLGNLLHYKMRGGTRDELKYDSKVSEPEAMLKVGEVESIELMIPDKDKLEDREKRVILSEKNNPIESVIWILSGIVGTIPIFVTLGYWVLVYPKAKEKTTTAFVATVFVHGVNAIFSILDTMINAIPIRVTQFVYLLTLGLTYAIFTGLYELAGGPYSTDPERPYIYAAMNWREKPKSALISSLVAGPTLIFLYLILWIFYILRLKLVASFSSRRDRDNCHYLHQYWLHKK